MSRSQQAIAVLTRPVAWQGRVTVWMILLAVALFAGNQWLRLRSEIASGVVSIAGQRFPTRPMVAKEIHRIAHQRVSRAPKGVEVGVRPLQLTTKQETALEGKFDLKLKETGTKVLAAVETPPAPRGAEVVVTVDAEGVPEVVVKAKPPRLLELGPWVADASVVQEFADGSVRFPRIAISKDLRVGKLFVFARASYDFNPGHGGTGEAGLRLKF